MTWGEVFTQVILEVSGKTEQDMEASLAAFRKTVPKGKWDTELPDDEAQKLLADLGKESSGILAWLVRGTMGVFRNMESGKTGSA